MGVFGFLQKNQLGIQNWTDVISKVAQVLALALAALWTYKTFYESERPGLERRLNTSIDGTWAAIPNDQDTCTLTLNVGVENNSKQAADVTWVSVAGWISDRISLKSEIPQFWSSEEVERGQKFFDRRVNSGVLIGHFPPGTKRLDAFVWLFRNEQNKVALMKVDIGTETRMKFGTNNYWWDYVCRGLPQACKA